jgi:large subunit ribosomal protein L6
MSRIGKAPISVPKGVEVNLSGTSITVKGPKGELARELHPNVTVERGDGEIRVKRSSDSPFDRSLHGLTRSLVNNMIRGVVNGFEKRLTLEGVGYRFQIQGKTLNLTLGYSHPIDFPLPEGITAEPGQKNEIVIKGIDKEKVGQVAADIRDLRPPEPYKGKGIRYSDEVIKKKPGKAAGAGAGTK